MSADTDAEQFKKRPGTSGISGQLYETKLISLILYRLLYNENVEDFRLASNMDDIGAFDDVCINIKLKDRDRHLLILVQAKHKENDDTTLDDKHDLVKWFDSINRVKEKFASNKHQDKIFAGKFEDIDCVFIVYTNAKYDFGKTASSKPYESDNYKILNDLVSTGTVSSQPNYTYKDIEDFGATILSDEIPVLAEQLQDHLNDGNSMNIMNSKYIQRYHVILRQEVVNVSEIQETRGSKCRILTFRDEFFENSDKVYVLLRKHLYERVLKNRVKIKNNKKLDSFISTFLSDPCAQTLSPLVENHITFKGDKLIFVSKRSQNDVLRLEKIQYSESTFEETKTMTAQSILSSLKLAVPIAFGNIDLAIRGTPEKIEQRLNHLTKVMSELCESAKDTNKIVTIDDSIDDGILGSNGGIGGCVGNILEEDETTKQLKFINDHTYLQTNARTFYLKLKDACPNLDEFRFDVQTSKFPKASLDCTSTAREFLSKLVIFAKQGNHFEVEKILKTEMQEYMNTHKGTVKVEPDVLFVRYHQEIQNWWMLPKSGPYITRSNNIYHDVIRSIIRERQIYRARTSLTNIKWRRYRAILKRGNTAPPSENESGPETSSGESKADSITLNK